MTKIGGSDCSRPPVAQGSNASLNGVLFLSDFHQASTRHRVGVPKARRERGGPGQNV